MTCFKNSEESKTMQENRQDQSPQVCLFCLNVEGTVLVITGYFKTCDGIKLLFQSI